MDDMREIVTVEQMDRLFLALAIAAPVLGLAFGAFTGRRASAGRGALKGFVVGLVGPVNLLLWKMYNVLTDRMGLDTVKNLLVQLGLFIALGVIAGLAFGFATKRQGLNESGSDGGDGAAPVTAGGPSPSRTPGAAKTAEDEEEPPRDA
jgi:hypothetical protein